MTNFARWYYDNTNKKVDNSLSPEEQSFFDIVGIKIPSVKSFISWLVLKGHIKSIVKDINNKHINIFKLPLERKINYLVKNVKDLEKLAKEYNKIFGNNSESTK